MRTKRAVKIFAILLCALAAGFACLGLSACGEDEPNVPYVPSVNTLSWISVDSNFSKTYYLLGEEFCADGLIVEPRYSNGGGGMAITEGFEVDSSAFDSSAVGEYEIKVSYTEGEETVSASYKVSVHEDDSDITPIWLKINDETEGEGVKREFSVGDQFSAEGLVVTVLFDDASERPVEDYSLDSSAYDRFAEGRYYITVGYTRNGKTVYSGYYVTVG